MQRMGQDLLGMMERASSAENPSIRPGQGGGERPRGNISGNAEERCRKAEERCRKAESRCQKAEERCLKAERSCEKAEATCREVEEACKKVQETRGGEADDPQKKEAGEPSPTDSIYHWQDE